MSDRAAALEAALTAIYQAARTDEKGEWRTARKYLNERGEFNDDLGSLERLIEAIAAPLLTSATGKAGRHDPR